MNGILNENLSEGKIVVCAWCMPAQSVYNVRPEWKGLGLVISHGICPSCRDVWKKQIRPASPNDKASGPANAA